MEKPILRCRKCGLLKSLEEFYKDSCNLSGYRFECKSCTKKYRRQPKGKRTDRKGHLKRYNVTLKQYDQMFEAQGGVCAICGGINFAGRRLSVDHDHKTKKVRGLLCVNCNRDLAILEKPNYLRLIEYLERYSG